jgi:hypothetical protein
VDLAFLNPAVNSPGCSADVLPAFDQASSDKALASCGTCSETLCQGQAFNNICKIQGGKTFRCLSTGPSCGQGTGTRECICWSGPLP